MKSVLVVLLLAIGGASVTGCGSSDPTQPTNNGTPPPQDSGAGPKKGAGRVPAPKK